MTPEGKITEVKETDIGKILELCKKVELRNEPEEMANNGFLMTAYSQHPEEELFFKSRILGKALFFLYEENGKSLGFVLGYSSKINEEMAHELDQHGQINWDKELLKTVGIEDIDEVLSSKNFAYLDKIAVDPSVAGTRVFKDLGKHFLTELYKNEIDYVFLKIVEEVYEQPSKKPLGIKNERSIKAHKKLGAVRVGDEYLQFNKSFLGEKGLIYCGIYAINVNESIRLKI